MQQDQTQPTDPAPSRGRHTLPQTNRERENMLQHPSDRTREAARLKPSEAEHIVSVRVEEVELMIADDDLVRLVTSELEGSVESSSHVTEETLP